MVDVLVCAKLVYDLENVLSEEWRVSEDGQSIPIESVGKIMNICDANALELALRLQDQLGQDIVRITVLTVGSGECRKMLSTARAVGAQRCVRIALEEPLLNYASCQTAQVLVEAITQLGRFDLLLFGMSAGEYDMGQTGLFAAELLNLPVIQDVISLKSLPNGAMEIGHLTDAGIATSIVRKPVVATVGTPPEVYLRSPTLKAVLMASKIQEEVLERSLPEAGQVRKLQKGLQIPREKKNCRLFDAAQSKEMATWLKKALDKEGEQP